MIGGNGSTTLIGSFTLLSVLSMERSTRTFSKEKICVECGDARVEALYEVSPHNGSINLIRCHLCGEVADKYIEVDGTLLLIDIILLRKPAYRHLLFNRKPEILSPAFLSLIIISTNYFVQITVLKKSMDGASAQSVRLVWLKLLISCTLEHVSFVTTVLLLLLTLQIFSTSRRQVSFRTVYTAIAFPEIFRICSIVDTTPALLSFLACFILAIQCRALESAYIHTRRFIPLYIIIAVGAVCRAGLRFWMINSSQNFWWLKLLL